MSVLLLVMAMLAAEPEMPSTSGVTPAATSPGAQNPETGLKPGETKVRMICRTETTTGTRFSKRICMTVEDAKRREEESSQGFSEMQRNVNTSYSRGN